VKSELTNSVLDILRQDSVEAKAGSDNEPRLGQMARRMLHGFRWTSLGTLASRVLGMLRDVATASLLGLESGTLDAFSIAFRLPNFMRRLVVEGAWTASYLPVLSARLKDSRSAGWELTSTALALTGSGLGMLVFAALLLTEIFTGENVDAGDRLAVSLSHWLLPYVICVGLTGIASASLQALGRFRATSLSPLLLNACWLVAAWGVAPFVTRDPRTQAAVISAGILLGGVAQVVLTLSALRAAGWTFSPAWLGCRADLLVILRGFGPAMLGLSFTQIHSFCDGWLAWGWGRGSGGPAMIYLGEQLYEFPLGIIGVAVGTACFPLLSAAAARGDRPGLLAAWGLGLRLVVVLGVPASAGLVLLGPASVALLFQHGSFDAADAARTGAVVSAYGAGVWAFCAWPVLVRGCQAEGDLRRPVWIGLAGLVAHLLAAPALFAWRDAVGLALGSSLFSGLQCVILIFAQVRDDQSDELRQLARTGGQTLLATVALAAAVQATLWAVPSGDDLPLRLLRVAGPTLAGSAAFATVAWLLGPSEFFRLWGLRGRVLSDRSSKQTSL